MPEVELKVEKIQSFAMITAALLAIVSGGVALFNLPMPRNLHIMIALLLLINGFILVWTVRRLKR